MKFKFSDYDEVIGLLEQMIDSLRHKSVSKVTFKRGIFGYTLSISLDDFDDEKYDEDEDEDEFDVDQKDYNFNGLVCATKDMLPRESSYTYTEHMVFP